MGGGIISNLRGRERDFKLFGNLYLWYTVYKRYKSLLNFSLLQVLQRWNQSTSQGLIQSPTQNLRMLQPHESD